MKKIILSLMLAFTLMPMVLFSVASASSVHEIPFGEVEVAVGEKKDLGQCIVNANSGEMVINFNNYPNVFRKYQVHITDSFGNNQHPTLMNMSPITVTLPLASGRQTVLNFAIENKGYSGQADDGINPVLNLDMGDNGCYDCTLSDGSKVSHGDCSADDDSQSNGASRILAPITGLLGGFLFLF